MATYRLFPSTHGPSSPVSSIGNFPAGVLFCVTDVLAFEYGAALSKWCYLGAPLPEGY
jgi:hypothetical protein